MDRCDLLSATQLNPVDSWILHRAIRGPGIKRRTR